LKQKKGAHMVTWDDLRSELSKPIAHFITLYDVWWSLNDKICCQQIKHHAKILKFYMHDEASKFINNACEMHALNEQRRKRVMKMCDGVITIHAFERQVTDFDCNFSPSLKDSTPTSSRLIVMVASNQPI
jgi:hypothetical protein